ncbi:MAG: hypothetical protein QXH03_02830 [Candidatus Bathyarchaeia archaeon]
MAEGYAEWLADYVWNTYTREFGHPPRRITRLELGHLTRFFVEECRERGIDPQAVDFYGEIFEDIGYYELQDKIKEILNLIKPLPKEPIEIGLDEALSRVEELGFRVREEDLRKVENVKALEDKIERLSRNVEKLRRELELEKARKEAAVKELERIRAGAPPPPPPPIIEAPAPRELTKEEVARLEDLFRATLFRELGRVPPNAIAELRTELETVKRLSFEEASRVIERLAMEIAERFKPAVPRAPPAVVPPAVRPPAPVRFETVRDVFEKWLMSAFNMRLEDFAGLSEERKKEVLARWVEHMTGEKGYMPGFTVELPKFVPEISLKARIKALPPQEGFEVWLKLVKHMDLKSYHELSEEKKREILDEWSKWIS